MSKEDQGLKLIKAEINNFKSIDHKSIDFGGKSAIIMGKNGAGKSSLIQALLSPVNSKMVPQTAIKNGEEKASIELQVSGTLNGEEQTYNIDMYFTEKDSKGRVVVFDESGGKIPGSKTLVNSIVGNIGFDILEFISMGLTPDGKPSKSGIKKQIDILKQFMPQDVQKTLHELDIEKSTIYDNRTEINKDVKSAESKLKGMDMDPELIEKYSVKMDDTKVKERMGKIGDAISQYDSVVSGIETKGLKVTNIEDRLNSLAKEMNSLKEELSEVNKDIEKGKAWLEKKGERPSMENLSKELEGINSHNDMYRKVVECKEHDKDVREFKKQSDDITERLATIEVEKKELFKENPLPVKDLTFSEDEIHYKELPFNENQHPSSTIIGVGLKIAMAMNPNLRLLIVKDGSLLDKKMLNFILKMVDKKGYQVFVEMVDFSGESELTIDFVEGEVE